MRRQLNVKLVLSVLAGLLIVSVAVHFVHGFQLHRNAYRLLERADRAVAEKEFDKALTYYEQYRTFVPNDIDTLQKYAELLDTRVGNDAERLRLILLMEQVLRAKPTQNDLRLRLVHNLIMLDRFSDAIDNLKKLPATDKADALHMIGWCQEAMQKYGPAAKSFEEAIRINPKQLKTYALLVEVLHDRLNQPDDAQKVLDDLVQANAESYQAYLMRARFLRRRGDDKTAESDLRRAFELGQDKPEVILEVADAARARGNWADATKVLQDAMKRQPNNVDFIRKMVDVKMLASKTDEAIDHLKKGLRQTPQSFELTVLLIDLLIDQKQYKEAREKIDELIKSDMLPALPSYLKARIAVANKDWKEAIKLLEIARKELGTTSDWHGRVNALLGYSYGQLGDREKEVQAFRQAVRHEPSWVLANIGLGTALLRNGKVDEAYQTLDPLRTAKDLPAGYWIVLSRADLQRQLRLPIAERRWDGVEETLAKADPKSVETAMVRAQILAARRDFVGSLVQRREFSTAEAELMKFEQPWPAELARLGAEIALGLRDAKLAMKRAESAVTLPTRDYRDALWLARFYQAAGETAKAENLLRESLDQAGHTPDAWIAWMGFLQQSNQRERVGKEMERLKKELSVSRQQLTIARCYEALQMHDQASKAYHDALQKAPDDFIVLAYAADFARRAEHAAEAAKLYERLLEPALLAPADDAVPARRHLAILWASSAPSQALALLDANKASRGDAIGDQRIRLFIQSLTPAGRKDALEKFQDSLRVQAPTPDERVLMARMLESTDNLRDARTQWAELVDEFPAAAQYIGGYARLLIRMNEMDDAERQLAHLETLEPGSERARDIRAALKRARD